MKKLFFAAFTAVLFLGACTQKKGLSGSEFTNPNILVAGADSIWDDFVHQEDSVIEQERANAIADFERQSQRQMTADETFPSWNSCESLTTLTDFVDDVTNPESANYISPENRIATFDMDGTFIGKLYPTYFEYKPPRISEPPATMTTVPLF